MTSADQALARVLRIQKINRLLGAVLVPAGMWFLLNALWPVGGFIWWLVFVILCGVGTHLFYVASFAITIFTVAATTNVEIPLEDDEPELTNLLFTIEDQPSQPIGKFLDVEFYEWLDLKDESGTVRRVNFFGTIDVAREFTLSPRCVLLPPGLLYEFAQVDGA